MKTFKLGKGILSVPAVGLGFWRAGEKDTCLLEELISTSIDLGINFFDHADIYGGGLSEEKFGIAFENLGIKREDVFIQSKCGIVPRVMYDFSEEHIIRSVEGCLRRLKTDYLDVLLLHRPDALVEPEEVASAFDKLHSSGKVHHFGVSNHRPSQIELLKKYVKQDIEVNQVQFSIACSGMISSGFETNMLSDGAPDRDGGVIDYCRLNDITLQAWSPFQAANRGGVFIGNEAFPQLNLILQEIAEKYSVSKTTIAGAWILRHPAHIQMMAGTMNPDRLGEIAKSVEIELSREEWYRLYLAAGHILP